MDTFNEHNGSVLELEQFPGRADIQISKVLTTARGDRFRAVLTTGGNVVLTTLGGPHDIVVTLTGDLASGPNDPVVYMDWIGMGIDIAIAIGKKILGGSGGGSGGGGGGCTTTITTTTIIGPDGTISQTQNGNRTCPSPS